MGIAKSCLTRYQKSHPACTTLVMTHFTLLMRFHQSCEQIHAYFRALSPMILQIFFWMTYNSSATLPTFPMSRLLIYSCMSLRGSMTVSSQKFNFFFLQCVRFNEHCTIFQQDKSVVLFFLFFSHFFCIDESCSSKLNADVFMVTWISFHLQLGTPRWFLLGFVLM